MILVTALLLLYATSASSAIIYTSDFETGAIQPESSMTDGWDRSGASCNNAWNFNVVSEGQVTNENDPPEGAPAARSGTKMVRMEERNIAADTCKGGNFRSELRQRNVYKFGNEYWAGMSVYFPTDGHFPLTGTCSHNGYIHQTKIHEDSFPTNQATTVGGQLHGIRSSTTSGIPYDLWFGNIIKDRFPINANFAGRWHDIVWHTRFTNSPFTEAWLDGNYLGSSTSGAINGSPVNPISNGNVIEFRIGQYVTPACGDDGALVQYYDAIRIGNASSSYAEVNPAQGGTQVYQCSDGVDNDSDGLIDYPDDPGCTGATDNNEVNALQCADGLDNDGDSLIDYPNDPGCANASDDDEVDTPAAFACSDGVDNDSDGFIDYPADVGCSSATDDDETNVAPPVPVGDCHKITGPGNMQRGSYYAPPYNVFDPSNPLLIEAACDDNAQAVDITIGDGSSTLYINKIAWVRSQYQPYYSSRILSGTLAPNTAEWIRGAATIHLPYRNTAPGLDNDILTYLCRGQSDGTFKCGCKDASCSSSYWSLQVFAVPSVSLTPPPSGGAATFTVSWLANASSDQVLDYSVYWGKTTQASTLVGTVTGTTLDVTSASLGVTTGDLVCFRLKARNGFGSSDYSVSSCVVM